MRKDHASKYNNALDGVESFPFPAPSERPRNVNVKVLSSSEISVSWEHVFEQSVEGYQVSSEVTLINIFTFIETQ